MPNRIRDPIHGFIHFDNAELKIINSPAFQRLRNIKQLAFTSYVYPGAMHSRFEHSLGVMQMASIAFSYLEEKHRQVLKQNFAAIGLSLKQAMVVLRLAGLLHDIGHLPFSHGGESILPSGKKHEDVSIHIIKEIYEEKLEKDFFSGVTNAVVNIIGKDEPIPELRILKRLLSGQVDVDRIDYLIRDSHYCGVDYGKFDYKRLLETIIVIKNDGFCDLGIKRGGVHVLESLILARYFMFTQVYAHRTRRIYDIYLGQYLKMWNKGQYENFSNAIKYDDVTLLNDIRNDAENSTNRESKELANRITRRTHHSVVYETNDHAGYYSSKEAIKVCERLKKEHGDRIDLILDEAKGKIHNFLRREDEEAGDEFFVQDDNGRNRLLTEESKVIRDMPKGFKVIRIYAIGTKKIIDSIKPRADNLI